MAKPLKVRILDHEYLIKSEEDLDQVFKIAEYVNEKIKEVNDKSGGLSEKKTAILAALNIASEYFQVMKERDDLLAHIRQRSKALIGNIDSFMG
ncbi:MAG: cell division protein ZapA [Deltaproteobacteria bacterium]|nr:cell division protein ZapA [Deltaproteobacteria bacterium]MBW1912550.1 cell division protein ZapA [Deltaproteobacteria bacterium]